MKPEEKIQELLQIIEEICRDTRWRYGQDSVCGLCEYDDCAYLGADGDWIGECPGFDGDECFELKEEFKRKYLKGGIMMRTADQARFLAEQNRNAKIREQENETARSIEEAIEAGKFETTIFHEIGRDLVAELRRKGYKVKIHDGGYNEIDTIISWSKDGDPAEKN